MSHPWDIIPLSRLASTTSESLAQPVVATAVSVAAPDHDLPAVPDHDIPAVLLRPPCDLEIVIPARNEVRRLPRTLMHTVQYLEKQPYSSSVVVIDNGSLDQTSDLVSRSWSDRVPVRLHGCARPGKGAAVRRGFLTSRARFVGFMDADLATPIETLDMVMPLLNESQVVIGSRHMNGASIAKRQPVHRTASGMFFRAMVQLVVPRLTDTQCGFKFFPGDVARSIAHHMRIDGFAFDVELLRAIVKLGVPIKEVPVVWSDDEDSTFRSFHDGARAIADVLELGFERSRSRSCRQ